MVFNYGSAAVQWKGWAMSGISLLVILFKHDSLCRNG